MATNKANLLIVGTLGFFCTLSFNNVSYAVNRVATVQQDRDCVKALTIHVGVSFETQNEVLEQSISNLLEENDYADRLSQDGLSLEEVGVNDYANGLSQDGLSLSRIPREFFESQFIHDHFNSVYLLDIISASVLTSAILRSSLSSSHTDIFKEFYDEILNGSYASELSAHDLMHPMNHMPKLGNMMNGSVQINPYIHSLSLRTLYLLLEDPHYSDYLTLQNHDRSISGWVFYKGGDIRLGADHGGLTNRYLLMNKAYVFFETSRRLYVFQISSQYRSTNLVLVFNKRARVSNVILAHELYRKHYSGLQSYFDFLSQFYQPELARDELEDALNEQMTISLLRHARTNEVGLMMYRIYEALENPSLNKEGKAMQTIRHYLSRKMADPEKFENMDIRISTLFRLSRLLGINIELLLDNAVDLRPYVTKLNDNGDFSENELDQLGLSINRAIVKKIKESSMSLRQLSDKAGVSINFLRAIVYHQSNPDYFVLKKIAQALGTTVVKMIKHIKLVKQDHHFNSQNSEPLEDNEKTFIEDKKTVERRFIGNRVKQAMSLAGMDSQRAMVKMLGKSLAGEQNITMKVLLKTSYATGVPLFVLVSDVDLADYIHPARIKQEPLPDEILQKAYKLIIYYIKRRINELGIRSEGQLSIRTQISVEVIKDLFSTRGKNMYYSTLSQMAEGLAISVPDLLKDLERDIEQFDQIDRDVEIFTSYFNHEKIKSDLEYLETRIKEVVQLSGLSNYTIRELTGWRPSRIDNPNNSIRIATLFKISRLSNIHIAHLIGHQDLSSMITSDTLERSKASNQKIQNFLLRLKNQIKKAIENKLGHSLPPSIEREILRPFYSPFVNYYALFNFCYDLEIDLVDFLKDL